MRAQKLTKSTCGTVAGRCGSVAGLFAYVIEIIAGRFCGTVCGLVRFGSYKSLILLRDGLRFGSALNTPPKGGGFGRIAQPPFLWGSSWLGLVSEKRR